MNIDFKVHNVSLTKKTADVELNGAKIQADVPVLEVELVTMEPLHGSLTLRFTGAQIEPARSVFAPDKIVSWDLSNPRLQSDLKDGAFQSKVKA